MDEFISFLVTVTLKCKCAKNIIIVKEHLKDISLIKNKKQRYSIENIQIFSSISNSATSK